MMLDYKAVDDYLMGPTTNSFRSLSDQKTKIFFFKKSILSKCKKEETTENF